MKKRFVAPLAAVLAMSMAFSSLAAVKLDTPVVRWSSKREALPEWTRVENASNEYQVEAFWDGKSMWDSRHTFSSTDTREWLKSSGFVNKLKDSGTYTFRVMALGDGNDTLNSDWSELSAPWTFGMAPQPVGMLRKFRQNMHPISKAMKYIFWLMVNPGVDTPMYRTPARIWLTT